MTGTVFRPRPASTALRWLFAALMVLVMLPGVAITAWLFLVPPVLGYTVTGGTLTVASGHRPFVRTRSASIGEIRAVEPADGPECRRLEGETLGGYCRGRFECTGIGQVWMAARCGAQAVVVRFADGDEPWLLSPADRDRFLAALHGGGEYREAPHAVAPPEWPGIFSLLVVASLPALVLVIAVIVRGPSRLAYSVGPDGIEVRTALTRRTFPIAGASARAVEGILGVRLAGVAVPGYHTGWYWFSGGRAKVYTAHVRGCFVVVETGGRRIVLDPAEPLEFLETLAAFGASVETGAPCLEASRG